MREKILKVLEKNARVDIDELAVLIGEDPEAVAAEVTAMEKENIISGYNTMINWDKIGVERVTAMIEVSVTPQRNMGFDAIARKIYQYPEVDSVSLISGGFDLMVTVEGFRGDGRPDDTYEGNSAVCRCLLLGARGGWSVEACLLWYNRLECL